MKYNKIISLLAIGTMVGPTLLASQQVFAEESSTIASDSATASSETQIPESSTESSVPQVPSESSTESEGSTEPEQVKYRLLVNGEQLPNNTLTDANGNQIVFQYDSTKGLVEGATVHYTVTLAAGFELKEVKILNSLNASVLTSGEINGLFTMPKSDVSIQFEVARKTAEPPVVTPKPEEKPDSNNSNNQNNSNKETSSSNSTNQTAPKPAQKPTASQNQSAARQPA